jgi:hypothetical protein
MSLPETVTAATAAIATTSTPVPAGTCLLHGSHGRPVCPSCSSSVVQSFQVFPIRPLVPVTKDTLFPDDTDVVTQLTRRLEQLAAEMVAWLEKAKAEGLCPGCRSCP